MVIEQWLEKKLDGLGISEAELSRKAGISQSVLSTIKTRNSIGPDVARKLAKALDMKQYQVFYELGLITEKMDKQAAQSPSAAEVAHLMESLSEDDQEEIAALVRVKARRKKQKEKAEG